MLDNIIDDPDHDGIKNATIKHPLHPYEINDQRRHRSKNPNKIKQPKANQSDSQGKNRTFFDPFNYPISKRTFFYGHIHPDWKPKNRTPQNRRHRNRKRHAQQTDQYLNHGSLDLGLNKQIHYKFYTIL